MNKLLSANQYRIMGVFAHAHENLDKRWVSWKDIQKLMKQIYSVDVPRSTWFKTLSALIKRGFVNHGARGLYRATVEGMDFFHVNEEINDFEKKIEPREYLSMFYSQTRHAKSITLHFIMPRYWIKTVKSYHDLYEEIPKIGDILVEFMRNAIILLLTEKSTKWCSVVKAKDTAIILMRNPKFADWSTDALNKVFMEKLAT